MFICFHVDKNNPQNWIYISSDEGQKFPSVGFDDLPCIIFALTSESSVGRICKEDIINPITFFSTLEISSKRNRRQQPMIASLYMKLQTLLGQTRSPIREQWRSDYSTQLPNINTRIGRRAASVKISIGLSAEITAAFNCFLELVKFLQLDVVFSLNYWSYMPVV